MKNYIFLFILVTSSIIFPTRALPINKDKNKIYPRESFIFIKKIDVFFSCKVNLCRFIGKSLITGSGSIVGHSKTNSYILTAAHVIRSTAMPFHHHLRIQNEKRKGNTIRKISRTILFDFNEKAHPLIEVVSYDDRHDIALLKTRKIKFKALYMAKRKPKAGDRLYNIAAPHKMFAKGMVPFYSGHFLGHKKFKMRTGHYKWAVTSIPTAKGASGSPILNSKGNIVGIISSVHRRFHHISLSPLYSDLKDFLEKSLSGEKLNMCLRKKKERPTSQPSKGFHH